MISLAHADQDTVTQPDQESSVASMVEVQQRLSANENRSLIGRILAKAQDGGLLLEDQSGRIHQLKADQVLELRQLPDPYIRLPPDQLAAHLLSEIGDGFAVTETEHYLICSDASELYTEFCSRLLEKVHTEFRKLFEQSSIRLNTVSDKLPVIIFRNAERFQQFARRQHPETDFTDVPGYYSVRDNQMLIAAASGDRAFRSHSDVIRELRQSPRQAETIVHEAVHQLAFNTGLQIRYADNPMWLSEGLAVYFESVNGRSNTTLWSRPGEPNRLHLPGFQAAIIDQNRLRLPLAELLASDNAFLSSEKLADAYAESWMLTHYLIHNHRPAFDRLLTKLSHQTPLIAVPPAVRASQITDEIDQSPSELELNLIRHSKRLRLRP